MKLILAKLALIRDEYEALEKDGFNKNQKYPFLSDKQITSETREKMKRHKVIITHDSEVVNTLQFQTTTGVNMILKTVRVDYVFHDVDSGESLPGHVVGEGSDTGDKAVYKAITGAFKYLYVKTFNIPTKDDPEEEEVEKYAPRPVFQQPGKQVNKF